MQSQNAFHNQQRFGRDVFMAVAYPQMLAKVIDGSFDLRFARA